MFISSFAANCFLDTELGLNNSKIIIIIIPQLAFVLLLDIVRSIIIFNKWTVNPQMMNRDGFRIKRESIILHHNDSLIITSQFCFEKERLKMFIQETQRLMQLFVALNTETDINTPLPKRSWPYWHVKVRGETFSKTKTFTAKRD